MMSTNDALRDANPHLMVLDVLRMSLRGSNPKLTQKLFTAKDCLLNAIVAGRHDEATGWINTLRTLKEALPPNRQLEVAIDGLAEVVVGMGADHDRR
jgi:hypothetical protein